jgi:hypothetical protein
MDLNYKNKFGKDISTALYEVRLDKENLILIFIIQKRKKILY